MCVCVCVRARVCECFTHSHAHLEVGDVVAIHVDDNVSDTHLRILRGWTRGNDVFDHDAASAALACDPTH